MRNLGISAGEVRQGNYYVLRNVDIPAILGESSYLTHPPVEEQLRLSNAQRLEAEAYFLGATSGLAGAAVWIGAIRAGAMADPLGPASPETRTGGH